MPQERIYKNINLQVLKIIMTYSDIKIITASPDDFEINRNELAQRLRCDRNSQIVLPESCTAAFNSAVRYKCAYIRTSVELNEYICDFGFMKIPSRDLYRNLTGCSEAFVMAFTTGIAVDRLLARLNITSQAEHFITDALSSAAIESFCDYACRIIRENTGCVPRFSPGYGDLDITFQEPLLSRLSARETLGITLNSAFLMTPVKSITAIMGIKKQEGRT
ncbi:MAG: hypothetical protein IJU51_00215 [Clostridia bacterium]|nr:hypothetical protein [Clostridia bacterium]